MTKLTWHVYEVNCDRCGWLVCKYLRRGYRFAQRTIGQWIDGPRCRGLRGVLGWDQYRYLGEAVGKDEADVLENWRTDQ